MSRHRNVRSMNYSEEYEGFDDVYGHSVEDDYCVSPSVAEQFIYDRSKRQQMSAFLGQEEEIAEEDEEEEEEGQQKRGGGGEPLKSAVKGLNLSDMDHARLQSCLEEVRNVIGDSISEQTVVEAVLSCDFNVEKALNLVLNNATEMDHSGAVKIMKTEQRRDKDDCTSCNSHPSPRVSDTLSSGCDFNEKVLGLPEQEGCEDNAWGISSALYVNNASHPLDSPVQEVGAKAQSPTAKASPDEGLKKMECCVLESTKPTLMTCEMVLNESRREPLNSEGSKCSIYQDDLEGKTCHGIAFSPDSSGGDLLNSEATVNQVFQPSAKLPSDSEDEDFSSLCSLVIHNRSGSSEYASKPSKLDSPVHGPIFNATAKDFQECESTCESTYMSEEPNNEITSDSEEDDFSSLCSLVVHNRSGSSENSSFVPTPIPSYSVPSLSMQRQTSIDPAPVNKSTGNFMPECSSEQNSDSDDEDFSLCSLVIRNRSTSSDLDDCAQFKAPHVSLPRLTNPTKEEEDHCLASKEKDPFGEPIDEVDSDSEEDNFSSLCSLVIHNRNTYLEGNKSQYDELMNSASCSKVPSLVAQGGDLRTGEEGNKPGKDVRKMSPFVIPPLVIQSKKEGGNEVMGKESGSASMLEDNQLSEDEDYVIDLCGTLKSMNIQSAPSVEEEDDSDEELVGEKVEGVEFVNKDVLNLPDEGSWLKDPVKGLELLDLSSENLSPFGRILCKNWECLSQAKCPQSPKDDSAQNVDIVAFLFDKESPDDVCRRLRSQKYLVRVEPTS